MEHRTLLLLKHLLYITLLLCSTGCYYSKTHTTNDVPHAHTPTSTTAQALAYLDSVGTLPKSEVWPNVNPVLFIKNVRRNVGNPELLYQGIATNFCSYAALSYVMLCNDPLGYTRLIVQLYKQGHARYGRLRLVASMPIEKYAGTLQLKGRMDIAPADQLWFLTMIDNFKGYLNLVDLKYDPGNENTLYAATNFAKFNGMARNFLSYKVTAMGSDLIHPSNKYIVETVQELQKKGEVVLFFDHERAYKRSNLKFAQLHMPTHFIVVKRLEHTDGDGNDITIRYWDYGGETEQTMPLLKFRNIVYGITLLEKK
ncbi:hypothetical protein [Deminuibacter soli]|uniref:Uncharacterized protein n=1 Tax=Deminuibacter soli TaxID=2291815 RepID=A0A3E1NE45_9BACT|nr:hypothetical protein [Deminuibacter soli]RFM26147.1 hypothetical protein DXN05_21335 [Deminuibacter soli]